MDPINALQNLTNQGTRNPMPAQLTQMMGNQMGMGNANVNPNVLQNLINVSLLLNSNDRLIKLFKHCYSLQQRAGQAQMQSMPNIRGTVPNAMPNTMSNVMPNSMPNAINAMNTNNMAMTMSKCLDPSFKSPVPTKFCFP